MEDDAYSQEDAKGKAGTKGRMWRRFAPGVPEPVGWWENTKGLVQYHKNGRPFIKCDNCNGNDSWQYLDLLYRLPCCTDCWAVMPEWGWMFYDQKKKQVHRADTWLQLQEQGYLQNVDPEGRHPTTLKQAKGGKGRGTVTHAPTLEEREQRDQQRAEKKGKGKGGSGAKSSSGASAGGHGGYSSGWESDAHRTQEEKANAARKQCHSQPSFGMSDGMERQSGKGKNAALSLSHIFSPITAKNPTGLGDYLYPPPGLSKVTQMVKARPDYTFEATLIGGKGSFPVGTDLSIIGTTRPKLSEGLYHEAGLTEEIRKTAKTMSDKEYIIEAIWHQWPKDELQTHGGLTGGAMYDQFMATGCMSMRAKPGLSQQTINTIASGLLQAGKEISASRWERENFSYRKKETTNSGEANEEIRRSTLDVQLCGLSMEKWEYLVQVHGRALDYAVACHTQWCNLYRAAHTKLGVAYEAAKELAGPQNTGGIEQERMAQSSYHESMQLGEEMAKLWGDINMKGMTEALQKQDEQRTKALIKMAAGADTGDESFGPAKSSRTERAPPYPQPTSVGGGGQEAEV